MVVVVVVVFVVAGIVDSTLLMALNQSEECGPGPGPGSKRASYIPS